MKTSALRPVVVVAGLLLTVHVPADEVIINNGDRLTGSVKATREDKLILETSYAGEVKVQLSNIQRIVTDKPVRIILDDNTQVTGVLSASDRTEMMIRGTGGLKHQPVSMARISSINPAKASTVQVTGQFNAGLDRDRGNTDSDQYHIDASMHLRWMNSRLNMKMDGDLERSNNKKSKQKGRLGIKYDYFSEAKDFLFHRKWYLWSGVGFEHDKFADLNLRTTTGIGPGFQIIETGRTDLSAEGGPSYIWENFKSSEDNDYAAARWALKFEHQIFKSWELQVFHNHHLRWSIEDTGNYVFNSEIGLRIPIIERMQASVQFNIDRNNSPAPDTKKNDYETLITGGYSW